MKQDTTPPNKKTPKNGSLKERVKKHLTDKNDVITEEDIKNIQVGGEEPAEEKTAEELAKSIEEKKQTSPWTILSEEDK